MCERAHVCILQSTSCDMMLCSVLQEVKREGEGTGSDVGTSVHKRREGWGSSYTALGPQATSQRVWLTG